MQHTRLGGAAPPLSGTAPLPLGSTSSHSATGAPFYVFIYVARATVYDVYGATLEPKARVRFHRENGVKFPPLAYYTTCETRPLLTHLSPIVHSAHTTAPPHQLRLMGFLSLCVCLRLCLSCWPRATTACLAKLGGELTPRWRSTADRGERLFLSIRSLRHSVCASSLESCLPRCVYIKPKRWLRLAFFRSRAALRSVARRQGEAYLEKSAPWHSLWRKNLCGKRSPGTGTGMPVCCRPSKAHNNS